MTYQCYGMTIVMVTMALQMVMAILGTKRSRGLSLRVRDKWGGSIWIKTLDRDRKFRGPPSGQNERGRGPPSAFGTDTADATDATDGIDAAALLSPLPPLRHMTTLTPLTAATAVASLRALTPEDTDDVDGARETEEPEKHLRGSVCNASRNHAWPAWARTDGRG